MEDQDSSVGRDRGEEVKRGKTLLSLSSSPLKIPPKLSEVPLVLLLGRCQSAYVAIFRFRCVRMMKGLLAQ